MQESTKSLDSTVAPRASRLLSLRRFLRYAVDGWQVFWLQRGGLGRLGRIAYWFATIGAPPAYKGRAGLARITRNGYVDPAAVIDHTNIRLGRHVYIGSDVVIFNDNGNGGPVALEDHVHLYRHVVVEVGRGGTVSIGQDTQIQPHCYLAAHKASIVIGTGVMIAPYCRFFPYNHGMARHLPMSQQPLTTNGNIVVGNDAWIGTGSTVLDGVRIGVGAVIGAGSIVTHDVPDYAIAMGNPARVVGSRKNLTVVAPLITTACASLFLAL
jgi:acetyltransferase-like isoleucine patch superfamily enzyme